MENFIPNCVNHKFTEVVRLYAAVWIPRFELRQVPRFFGVTQVRGRAFYRRNVITIPDWLLRREDSDSYIQEYIIHELCHIKDYEQRGNSDHGPEFWKIFCAICPPEWWHYEESYKPREFKRAGMHLLDVFAPGKRPQDLTEEDV